MIDQRIEHVLSRRALVDEVLAAAEKHYSWRDGCKVKHFHRWYRRDGLGVPARIEYSASLMATPPAISPSLALRR